MSRELCEGIWISQELCEGIWISRRVVVLGLQIIHPNYGHLCISIYHTSAVVATSFSMYSIYCLQLMYGCIPPHVHHAHQTCTMSFSLARWTSASAQPQYYERASSYLFITHLAYLLVLKIVNKELDLPSWTTSPSKINAPYVANCSNRFAQIRI